MDTQIPGASAIPTDMPDAPHGDMPLEYNLQNFNGLVAANTAMETEIGSLNQIIEDLRDRLSDQRREIDGNERGFAALAKELDAAKKALVAANGDAAFMRDQRDVLQRRLDRTLGFVDRVLDEEASLRAPAERKVPVTAPSVGPDIASVPEAVRRDEQGRIDMPYAFAGEPLRMVEPTEPRRRY